LTAGAQPPFEEPAARTVDDLLDAARARLRRLAPEEALAAVGEGAVIVDIRSELQRARDGVVPGAVHHPRNVLEWRCDPTSPHRDPEVAQPGRELIVMCDAGYQSSLAARVLKDLGLERATDVAGGFQAWRAAGLPVEPGPALG
jgi:rhodanese-related sulfurtransferase